MGDVSAAIRNYIDDEIRLSQQDLSQSVKSREWFLQRIENAILQRTESGAKEPALYKNMIGFGSYFKGTKVQVVDEFDMLLVIDSNRGVFSQSGQKVGEGQGTASPNHKYNSKFYKSDDSGVSPAKILNWLKDVVTEVVDSFGGEAPDRNGQAITATITSQNLKIDLVPGGVFTRVSDGTTFYNIPRGDKNNGWIVTSPRADIERLNNVAKGKDDFRNVVRIAKRVKDTYNLLISSFAIETAIITYAEQCHWYGDLSADVISALTFLAGSFRAGVIADPYNSNNNLISGVENLKWYADRIDKIVTELNECKHLDDQTRVAVRVHRVFENS